MIRASDLPLDVQQRMGIVPKAENKYKVSSKDTRTADGITFHSKAEMHYYRDLKAKQAAGIIWFFLRQVRIDLPGNTKYVVDFVVFYDDGGCGTEWIDVKGARTAAYIKAKKQVEALYPFKITEIPVRRTK